MTTGIQRTLREIHRMHMRVRSAATASAPVSLISALWPGGFKGFIGDFKGFIVGFKGFVVGFKGVVGETWGGVQVSPTRQRMSSRAPP